MEDTHTWKTSSMEDTQMEDDQHGRHNMEDNYCETCVGTNETCTSQWPSQHTRKPSLTASHQRKWHRSTHTTKHHSATPKPSQGLSIGPSMSPQPVQDTPGTKYLGPTTVVPISAKSRARKASPSLSLLRSVSSCLFECSPEFPLQPAFVNNN